jgi:CHAD domain-containing protein
LGVLTAATLLQDRLVEQQRALVEAEAAVRRREPEGIHDLRVSMRRIRSVLASFRPIVDASVTEPLRTELRWAAGRLGEARDAEVVAERIVTLLDEIASDTAPEVLVRLRERVHADAAAVRDVVDETLDSERYAAALVLLDAVGARPPFTDEAQGKARPLARRRLRREADRVLGLAEEAWAATEPEERAAQLHDVRKGAKRLRYAAEACEPVLADRATKVAGAAEQIQTTLGTHHDEIVTRAALRRIAEADEGDEAGAFLLGRLDALEELAEARVEHRAAKDIAKLKRVAAKQLG